MGNNKWAERLAERVELKRQTEFIRFVTTGEASDEFLLHLDLCQSCKNAIEEAFKIISRRLEALAKTLAQGRNNM